LLKVCSVENLGLSFLRKQESIVCTGFWIPAPRFCGDKFTPAKAGAGMTDKSVSFQQSNSNENREAIITITGKFPKKEIVLKDFSSRKKPFFNA
jgi:hypothetical protein